MGKIKQYKEEFKRQGVKHVFQTGNAVAQVARELGISVNTLHGWVKKYKQEITVIQHGATYSRFRGRECNLKKAIVG